MNMKIQNWIFENMADRNICFFHTLKLKGILQWITLNYAPLARWDRAHTCLITKIRFVNTCIVITAKPIRILSVNGLSLPFFRSIRIYIFSLQSPWTQKCALFAVSRLFSKAIRQNTVITVKSTLGEENKYSISRNTKEIRVKDWANRSLKTA